METSWSGVGSWHLTAASAIFCPPSEQSTRYVLFGAIRELCPFANKPVRFAKFNVRFASWFQFANGKKFCLRTR